MQTEDYADNADAEKIEDMEAQRRQPPTPATAMKQ